MKSTLFIDRRRFLTLLLGVLLTPRGGSAASGHRWPFTVDIGMLYKAMTFKLEGTVEEAIDRVAGRYRVLVEGAGAGVANRSEFTGVLTQGRWTPVRSESRFEVAGRESRTAVAYDWARRVVQYHARGETFFLKRLRVVDDVVIVPAGEHVDDVMSAILNYADAQWPGSGEAGFRTLIVRRKRGDNEGPDDVASSYRAELAPLELKIVPDGSTGKMTALFDFSRFSSWARPGQPARITFSQGRRPELISSPLILGTSVTIRFAV